MELRKWPKFIQLFPVLICLMISFVPPAFSAEKIPTKVIVRVVSKDAKVIGLGVGGAFVRMKNLESGEILAQGKQEGGTGDTDRIMVQPHRRGEPLYGTPDAAFFQAEIPLEKPTRGGDFCRGPSCLPSRHAERLKDTYPYSREAHPGGGIDHRTERVDCQHSEFLFERGYKRGRSRFGEG